MKRSFGRNERHPVVGKISEVRRQDKGPGTTLNQHHRTGVCEIHPWGPLLHLIKNSAESRRSHIETTSMRPTSRRNACTAAQWFSSPCWASVIAASQVINRAGMLRRAWTAQVWSTSDRSMAALSGPASTMTVLLAKARLGRVGGRFRTLQHGLCEHSQRGDDSSKRMSHGRDSVLTGFSVVGGCAIGRSILWRARWASWIVLARSANSA